MNGADLSRYKENPKTAYLYAEYQRLEEEEKEIQSIAAGELGELAEEDFARIEGQKKAILEQMESILKSEEQ
ncbi:hypothetical protein H7X87_03140 [Acetobacteraceae bacterium]|nr:hypothetical protein [Candidatus Parcubacteria bacterium]